MEDPILIMALPRSGSSMTAGIFAQHGVWMGTCQPGGESNPTGSWEMVGIKRELTTTYPTIVQDAALAEKRAGFRETVGRLLAIDGYPGGPWLFKGSAAYWPAFYEFDPKFVVCRRDEESTLKSHLKVFGEHPLWKGKSLEETREVIRWHHEQMDFLVREFGAAEVDTESVAHGDFSTIREAIEFCGLEFSRDKTANFVDPKLWHYR